MVVRSVSRSQGVGLVVFASQVVTHLVRVGEVVEAVVIHEGVSQLIPAVLVKIPGRVTDETREQKVRGNGWFGIARRVRRPHSIDKLKFRLWKMANRPLNEQ